MTTNSAQTRLLEGLNEDLRGEFQAIIMSPALCEHGARTLSPGVAQLLRGGDP